MAWKDPEKRREYAKQRYDYIRDNLTDTYIAQLVGVPVSELTPEIIELKRESISKKRANRILRGDQSYYEANREKRLKQAKEWSKKFRDRKNELSRAYYKANPDKRSEYRKRYKEKNSDAYRKATNKALCKYKQSEKYTIWLNKYRQKKREESAIRAQHRQQFCKHGHDKSVVGNHPILGCLECFRIRTAMYSIMRMTGRTDIDVEIVPTELMELAKNRLQEKRELKELRKALKG